MIRTAILVDSAFYQKRANILFGQKSGQDRATELYEYCKRHLRSEGGEQKMLYRIFVYDCHPSDKTIKLALVLCIALDKKFEDLFYF